MRKSHAPVARNAGRTASNLGNSPYVAAMTLRPTDVAAGMEQPAQETAWRAEIIDTLRLAWPMAADAARPDRHDDDRPDAARPPRRPGGGGDRAGAHRAVRGVLRGHGHRLGGGAAGLAGLWRAPAAHRAPRAARRTVGGADDRRAAHGACSCGVARCSSRSARRRSPRSSPGRYLDGLAWCLVPAWAFLALRNFMGAVNRPEPALWITLAAIPANLRAGLRADLRRLRPAGARPAGRRHRHHARQHRHVRGGGLGVLRAPPVQEVSRARPLLAPGLAVVRQAACEVGAADLGHLPARVRRVRGRGPADGHDRHDGAGGASDRAADGRHHVHGAVRHLAGGNRARRPCGRPARCRRRAQGRLRRHRARHRLHGRRDAAGRADAAQRSPTRSWERAPPVPRRWQRSPPRCWCSA